MSNTFRYLSLVRYVSLVGVVVIMNGPVCMCDRGVKKKRISLLSFDYGRQEPLSKIIHTGKVLKEGTPVTDYGVAGVDMFVVMVNEEATELSVDVGTKPVEPTTPDRKHKASDTYGTSDDGDDNTSLIMTLVVGPHPHNDRLAVQEPHTHRWVEPPTSQPDGDKMGAGKMGGFENRVDFSI